MQTLAPSLNPIKMTVNNCKTKKLQKAQTHEDSKNEWRDSLKGAEKPTDTWSLTYWLAKGEF